jgi:hypothetical protein
MHATSERIVPSPMFLRPGKSKERLGDIVSSMMPSVKADLTKAILSRK